MKKLFAAVLCVVMFAAAAFAAPKYNVGIIQLVEHPSLDEIRAAILGEFEAAEDCEIVVSYQNGQNSPALINSICQKFVSDGVDVILPIATSAAQGAAAVTDTIPIVFAAVADPIAAGLVLEFEHPDRNITGVAMSIQPDKVLDLAEELTPGLKNYGFVYDGGEVNAVSTVNKAKAEMDKRGITYTDRVITNSSEVAAAANALVGKVDAFFIPNSNTVAVSMTVLAQIAIENKIPAYTAVDSLVNDGGLATCGINYTQLGKQAGQMTIRILKGAAVADTPVEELSKASIVVNPATAAALGVDVSKYVKE